MTDWLCLAIFYAFIAPLILAFAVTGLSCVYFVYKYNLIYVYDAKALDPVGGFYPRATMQLMVGLYLAQMHLIGLFAINSAWVQMSLMVFLFVSTIFIHVSIRKSINPLLNSFPRTLSHDEEGFGPVEGTCMGNVDGESDVSQTCSDSTPFQGRKPPKSGNSRIMKRFLQRLALPTVNDLRKLIPQTPPEKEFPDEYSSQRYLPPEIWLPKPKLWIPRDDSLPGQQEVELTKNVLPICHDGVWLDEKRRIKFDLDASALKHDVLLYKCMRLIL